MAGANGRWLVRMAGANGRRNGSILVRMADLVIMAGANGRGYTNKMCNQGLQVLKAHYDLHKARVKTRLNKVGICLTMDVLPKSEWKLTTVENIENVARYNQIIRMNYTSIMLVQKLMITLI